MILEIEKAFRAVVKDRYLDPRARLVSDQNVRRLWVLLAANQNACLLEHHFRSAHFSEWRLQQSHHRGARHMCPHCGTTVQLDHSTVWSEIHSGAKGLPNRCHGWTSTLLWTCASTRLQLDRGDRSSGRCDAVV